MGSVKGTEGDAEASGNQWVEEVIPAPRLKGQGKEIVQLELWSSGGEVTCKESRQSPGAKEHEKTAHPFLLFLISRCFFPLAKPN